MPRPALPCERAREWASLRLDGELSQLQSAMLGSHLNRCAECRAVVAETEAITDALRTAPLEALRRPLTVPRRHAALRVARVTAAAAVMLVAAGLGSVFATSFPSTSAEHAAVPRAAGLASDDRVMRDTRRAQLQIERAMLQTNSRAQIGHVL